MTKEAKPAAKAEETKEAKPAAKAEVKFLDRNVKHDNEYYEMGKKIDKRDPNYDIFEQKGFLTSK